jgi:hypothetical protein
MGNKYFKQIINMKFCSTLEEANKVTTAGEGLLFENDPETSLQSMGISRLTPPQESVDVRVRS